jgi:hypothetical protein
MFPAVGQNLKLGRGSLLLAPHDGTSAEEGLILMGNIPSLELSWEVETREKYSSTQASSPLLDQAVIRQTLTVTAQCDEHTKENLKRFFFGTEAAADQALSTTGAKAITDLVVERAYDLGKRQVTNVVGTKGSTALVSGTDYTLYASQGMVVFHDTATISDGDDVNFAFDCAAVNIDHIRLGRVSQQFAKLVYIADDANQAGAASDDRWVFWKTQVTPDGAYQLVSDDYTSFNLAFKVLSDNSQTNDPLGRIERVS